jgi:hypothetical protein
MSPTLALTALLTVANAAPLMTEAQVAQEALLRFDGNRDGTVTRMEMDARGRAPGVGTAMDASADGTVSADEFVAWTRRQVARLPRPTLPEDPSVAAFPVTLFGSVAYAKPRKDDADKVLLHIPDFQQALTVTELQLVTGGATTTANDAGQPPDLKAADHLYSGWVAKPSGKVLSLEIKAGDQVWKGDVDPTGADAATPLPVDRKQDGTLAGLPIPAHDAPAGQPPPGMQDATAAGGLPTGPGAGVGQAGQGPAGPPPGMIQQTVGGVPVTNDTPIANTSEPSGVNPLVIVGAALAAGIGIGIGVALGPSLRKK